MDRRTFLRAAGTTLAGNMAGGGARALTFLLPGSAALIAGNRAAAATPALQAAAPKIVSVPFDISRVTADLFQYNGGRYDRYKELLVFTTDAIDLQFQVTNWAAGGRKDLSFGFPAYALRVRPVLTDGSLSGGNERATYVRVGAERKAALVGVLGAEPDGPCLLEILGVDDAGRRTSLMTHGAYIDRRGQARNHPLTILQNCSRDWETLATMDGDWPIVYQYSLVPIAAMRTTRVKPLTPRLGTPFETPLPPTQLTRIEYVISSNGVGTAPGITKTGIFTTESRQNYAFSDLKNREPHLPLLDGPRGVCTTPYTTDLVWGRNGKLYGANPWQAWVLDATGHKRTLYGLRHRYPPLWSEATIDGPEVEVVGDWDPSIPLDERFAWESWGMAWDTRTLSPIDDAAPIPPGETEHPHQGAGPVHFRTDRHGYVLRVQFDGHSHATPAKITRWITANDPWSIFYLDGKLYVTERGLHRISIWSADKPETYLGDLVSDTAAGGLGAINPMRRRWEGADYTTCRLRRIVAPEGLIYLDGYAYWGSRAQREVRRIPVKGGPIETACRPKFDSNSNYCYLASSDGNFGPRGTLFVTTWSNANHGRPFAFMPVAGQDVDGTPCTHTSFVSGSNAKRPPVNAAVWDWEDYAQNVLQGPGGKWITDSYGSAVAAGRASTTGRPDDPAFGALACSSANGNVSVYVQSDFALDGVAPDYAKANRGGNYYRANHQLVHGPWCAGPDLPLPWGEDPDCDYFMELCGYSRA
jgi:hypothetical protein